MFSEVVSRLKKRAVYQGMALGDLLLANRFFVSASNYQMISMSLKRGAELDIRWARMVIVVAGNDFGAVWLRSAR
ncbi:MAG: hypothetical protein R3C68_19325 [Myxococcota bacterium]